MEYKNIYQKLLAAQMEIGAITKTQDNPFFHSKYADINAILAVVKPILNKHGLVLTQGLKTQVERENIGLVLSSQIAIETTITSADDQQAITGLCVVPTIPDPQKQGSAITYFRRYSLQSLLALEVQDDDGNSASEKSPEYPKSYTPKKNSKLVNDFMGDLEPTDEEIILQRERLESAKDLDELKKIWTTVPPMVKDKLEKVKNEMKFKLT